MPHSLWLVTLLGVIAHCGNIKKIDFYLGVVVKKKIIIESPFANENPVIRNENLLYLNVVSRTLMLEPNQENVLLFFHSLYTQFLNDNIKVERDIGLYRSFEFHSAADCKLYAIDRGISTGMRLGAADAIEKGMDIKFFTLCQKGAEVSEKIEEINAIDDVVARWETGVAYITKLMDTPGMNHLGDLTNYRTDVKDEYDVVKKIMRDFFYSLVTYIDSK